MQQFKRALACTLILISNSCLAAANWTNYQGNAAHTGYIPVKTNPAKMQKSWQQTLTLNYAGVPSNWYDIGGAIIIDNTAYVTMQKYYFAPHSSSEMYPASAMFAIDLNSGQIKWQQVQGKYHQASAPIYDNGRIYVMDYNFNTETYQMIAYLADSGKEDYKLPVAGTGIFGPIAANGNVYTTWKNLESINGLTGKINWSVPMQDTLVPSIPAVTDQYVILNGINEIDVADVKTGQSLFKIAPPGASWYQGIITTPVYDAVHQTVYQNFRSDLAANGMATYAFDLTTRQVKWLGLNSLSQVTVSGEDVFAIGGANAKRMKANSNPLELQAFDAKTGVMKWSWHLTGKEFFDYGRQRLVATDDVVFIPLDKSTVAISRASHNKVWESNETGILVVGNDKLLILGWDENGVNVSGISLV